MHFLSFNFCWIVANFLEVAFLCVEAGSGDVVWRAVRLNKDSVLFREAHLCERWRTAVLVRTVHPYCNRTRIRRGEDASSNFCGGPGFACCYNVIGAGLVETPETRRKPIKRAMEIFMVP